MTNPSTPLRFTAFISYRHAPADTRIAKWLDRELRNFRLPLEMAFGHPGYNRKRPQAIGRVFRDDDDLPAAADLDLALKERLLDSGALIVVCLPGTPSSDWIEREVQYFMSLGRGDRIFLILGEGSIERSVPRSLLRRDATGGLSASQPVVASLIKDPGESSRAHRRRAVVKLVAAIVGVDPDVLWRRTQREQWLRRLTYGLVVSAALAVVSLAFGYRMAQERDRVLRLSDLKILNDLHAEFARLGAPLPANIQAMKDWHDRALEVLVRRPRHESDWEELTGATRPYDEARPTPGRPLTTELAWMATVLQDLLQEIDRLERVEMQEVQRRLDVAATIRYRTVDAPEAKVAWDQAIEGVRESRLYQLADGEGFVLQPQVGLLPLSPNDEGYWEFWHVLSGNAPTPADSGAPSRWRIDGDTGIVLVLVPGGEFLRGAQASDPGAPSFDPLARAEEGPTSVQRVEPLFVSKYEMTQGQWERASGRNPSYFKAGFDLIGANGEDLERIDYTDAHPVEEVSWNEVTSLLPSLDLELPTETEWEHAARDGTLRWVGGDSVETIGSSINCQHSLLMLRLGKPDSIPEPWKVSTFRDEVDGFVAHAAVGSLGANHLGIHEVLGNVWELCSNRKTAYEGNADTGGRDNVVMRGGGFSSTEASARFTRRSSTTPSNADYSIGLRPVRRISK